LKLLIVFDEYKLEPTCIFQELVVSNTISVSDDTKWQKEKVQRGKSMIYNENTTQKATA
jgi:hypothetical protein